MTENHFVAATRNEMQSSYEQGFWDGYNATGPLPGFYSAKSLIMLKPYERGYFVGREVRIIERNNP
jgi:hypothetical protein